MMLLQAQAQINTQVHLLHRTASKWAVRGLTKVAASELGPMIRVNSVHPGPIDTPMIHDMLTSNLDVLAGLQADTPLARVGTAEEVADLVLFLASDESSYCTGSEFVVDGGGLCGLHNLMSG